MILLGIGVQGGMSANQTHILTIRPEAGSRMNTVFLVPIFACGAVGGAVGFIAWLILDYSDTKKSA